MELEIAEIIIAQLQSQINMLYGIGASVGGILLAGFGILYNMYMKKDAQVITVYTTVGKVVSDLTPIINNISTSTANIPLEVRGVLKEDFNALQKSVNDLK